MRRARWIMVALVLALVLSSAPAQASGPNVEIVDVGTANRPNEFPELLAPEELTRLDQIMAPQNSTSLGSPLSPDGNTAWAFIGNEAGFLDVQSGAFTPYNLDEFGALFPAGFLGLTPLAWANDDVLYGLGLDLFANRIEQALIILQLDRRTGAIGASRLDPSAAALFFQDNFLPLSYGPNGTRVVAALLPPAISEEQALQTMRIGMPSPTARLSPDAPVRLDRRIAAGRAQDPRLVNQLEARLAPTTDRSSFDVTTTEIEIIYLDLASGDRRSLTTIDDSMILLADAWSPDSARYALTITGFPDIGAERDIFDGALISEQIYRDVTGQLSPAENPYYQNNTVRIFDVGTGLNRTLRATDVDGTLQVGVGWSTDNRTLLVQALHPARINGRAHPIYTFQFAERYSYRFYDEELRPTGRLDIPQLMSGPNIFGVRRVRFVSPDELIFTAVSGTNLHLYYYNRISGELRNLADRAGAYGVQGFSSTTRQIVFIQTSYTQPLELFRMNWDGRALAQLTFVNEELRQSSTMTQHPVSFRLRNGQTRTGTMLLPAGVSFPPRNVPMVVWQEGGPGGAMLNTWGAIVEAPYALLPNYGMGLLIVPLAGREGYDAATLNLLASGRNFGSIDIDEQAEIVQQAITRGYTSRGRVGITGCSYGGYFVWQSVIRHPDLYAAGNPQCALVDVVTEWTRGYTSLMPYLQGPQTPYNASAEFRADSPIYNTAAVRAAMLSFHGTFDFLPYVQNENLHLQLQAQGKTSKHLRFVGAGHGLLSVCCDVPFDAGDRYEHYAAQSMIQWFRSYLR